MLCRKDQAYKRAWQEHPVKYSLKSLHTSTCTDCKCMHVCTMLLMIFNNCSFDRSKLIYNTHFYLIIFSETALYGNIILKKGVISAGQKWSSFVFRLWFNATWYFVHCLYNEWAWSTGANDILIIVFLIMDDKFIWSRDRADTNHRQHLPCEKKNDLISGS